MPVRTHALSPASFDSANLRLRWPSDMSCDEQGYQSKKEFIAAQGPLPGTVNDFWRMIWEKNVRTMVMLTRCNEQGRVSFRT